jgi:hypothetical protein
MASPEAVIAFRAKRSDLCLDLDAMMRLQLSPALLPLRLSAFFAQQMPLNIAFSGHFTHGTQQSNAKKPPHSKEGYPIPGNGRKVTRA